MIKLRLQRRGKKNYATYRVVAADQHAPIQGKFLADLGFYNPHTKAFTIQAELVNAWIQKGAKPSATVHNLLVTHGILAAAKVRSWRPKKKEQPEAATTEQAKKEESAKS